MANCTVTILVGDTSYICEVESSPGIVITNDDITLALQAIANGDYRTNVDGNDAPTVESVTADTDELLDGEESTNDSQDNSIEDVFGDIVEGETALSEFALTIRDRLLSLPESEELTIERLLEWAKRGGLGNYTMALVREMYPYIYFNDGVLANFFICDNFRIGNDVYIGDRILLPGLDVNGDLLELIVTSGDPNEIRMWAKYLNLRHTLEVYEATGENKFNKKDSKDYLYLLQVLDERKKNNKGLPPLNVNLMLLEYLNNKDIYINMSKVGGKFVGTELARITEYMVEDVTHYHYVDGFVENVNQLKRYVDGEKSSINTEVLFDVMKSFKKSDLDELGITKLSEFKEFLKTDLAKEIINLMFNIEPGFVYLFGSLSSDGNTVILRKNIRTLGERYPELRNPDLSDFAKQTRNIPQLAGTYRGFHIYQYRPSKGRNVVWFATNEYLDPDVSYSHPYNSEDEAHRGVDDKIARQSLVESSKLILHFSWNSFKNNGYQNLPEGTYIETIPIDLDQDITDKLTDAERDLLYNPTMRMEHFYRWFFLAYNAYYSEKDDAELVHSMLDTPEKAAIFIYLTHDNMIETGLPFVASRDNVMSIMQRIDEAAKETPRAFYIDRSRGYTPRRQQSKLTNKVKGPIAKTYSYTILPSTYIDFRKSKGKQRDVPTLTFFQAVHESLSGDGLPFNGIGLVTGTTAELRAMEELQDALSEVVNAKAFIHGNNIYVNTDNAHPLDLFHEYVHLILGVMKTDPELVRAGVYDELMGRFASFESVQKDIKKYSEIYKNDSQMSIIEEVFADYYAKMMLDLAPEDVADFFRRSNILAAAAKMLDDGNRQLFDVSFFDDMKNMTLYRVFDAFNSAVKGMLYSEGNTLSFNTQVGHRQAARWISKLINETKQIEENCK